MNDSLNQLRTDLMYLARRQKALEDDLAEWTEFMTVELLKQGIYFNKQKRSFNYFRESLKGKFKTDYDKFEILFSAIEGKRKSPKKKPKGAVPL